MEIRNLLTFVHVAELNSFTKAAKALDYSQSTVSFQIKQLETELDCLLFERINHTISLTEKGKVLLDYAQKITHLTDEFNQERYALQPLNGHIHIVTPDSVCEDMVLKNYENFHYHFPNISLKFTTADTKEMFRMLNQNEADLMLTLDNRKYQNDYVIAKEERSKMHFVTGTGSSYAQAESYLLKDLIEFPFILTEKGIGYRRVFDDILAQEAMEITPILEIGRTDIIVELIEKGMGISFLPDFVTEEKVKAGKIKRICVKDAEFDIWKQLIYHKNKWISKSLGALIEYIKENEFST